MVGDRVLGSSRRASVGGDHRAAVRRRDRRVGGAGDDGDGTYEPRAQPTLVAGITDAVEVRVAFWSTCARHADGRVSCWGSDDRGPLGLGTEIVVTTPRRIAIPER